MNYETLSHFNMTQWKQSYGFAIIFSSVTSRKAICKTKLGHRDKLNAGKDIKIDRISTTALKVRFDE